MKSISTALLPWFDQHGRKELPWQKDKTPYRVWVSEIMLQQTQVSTVIDYFQRFMERFPSVNALANAPEDDVLHLWTGLGYYQRARNLHKTAKIICNEYHSVFPTTLSELETLPGIGKSTAGAISSIALGIRAPILDGNVKRVLTRFHGITEWSGEKKTLALLWELADQHTPAQRVADYTQAIMDLGATLCKRSKPTCSACPLQQHCCAYAKDLVNDIPASKPKKSLPERNATLILLVKKPHFVLLEKRQAQGVWKGLWSLPEITQTSQLSDIRKACLLRFHYKIDNITLGEPFRHTFSHYHLNVTPAIVHIHATGSKIMDEQEQIWYNLQQPQALGLPAPVKKLLHNLEMTLCPA